MNAPRMLPGRHSTTLARPLVDLLDACSHLLRLPGASPRGRRRKRRTKARTCGTPHLPGGEYNTIGCVWFCTGKRETFFQEFAHILLCCALRLSRGNESQKRTEFLFFQHHAMDQCPIGFPTSEAPRTYRTILHQQPWWMTPEHDIMCCLYLCTP